MYHSGALRTASLQESITEHLDLFSFILHFEYYSSDLEDFFFLSTALAPGKKLHQLFLGLHVLSAHFSFFSPVKFDLLTISDDMSTLFHHALVLTDTGDCHKPLSLLLTKLQLTTCSKSWLHPNLTSKSALKFFKARRVFSLIYKLFYRI